MNFKSILHPSERKTIATSLFSAPSLKSKQQMREISLSQGTPQMNANSIIFGKYSNFNLSNAEMIKFKVLVFTLCFAWSVCIHVFIYQQEKEIPYSPRANAQTMHNNKQIHKIYLNWTANTHTCLCNFYKQTHAAVCRKNNCTASQTDNVFSPITHKQSNTYTDT